MVAKESARSFFAAYELIAGSGLFDCDFYIETNPDVAGTGGDPLTHYLEYGAQEGRAPHPDFDTEYYLSQCIEPQAAAANPLLHYLVKGRVHGLQFHRGAEVSSHVQASELEWMIGLALESGLFDRDFYNRHYGFQFDNDESAVRHYYSTGEAEGKRPNLYFDPAWYLQTYADLREAKVKALHHFLVQGESEGRRASVIFDTESYRAAYNISHGENTLAHYLKNCITCRFSPIPDFDVVFYGDVNNDVRAAGVDPFEHFLLYGFREGRNPSPNFNLKYYTARHMRNADDVNPFLHYLQHKHEPGVHGSPPADEASVPRAVRQFAKAAPEFELFKPLPESLPRKAKVLAYYLPQFHTFPENDSWWGTGFTEWSNIARGVSRFRGHYQPRIPRDLGFYSLEDALPTLRRQVEMAKGGGLHGFVFYYYWFNGKRLMERPVEQFLRARDIDMPFAMMWANENWTRRWDGDEHEVLIAQDYDPEDDEALAADLVRHFKDPRYIRVQGRPLLMLYRPGIIPKAREALLRWRGVFKDRFKEDPLFIMAQAFNDTDPAVYGFDGAIEFPPHKLTANMNSINDNLEYLDVEFNGKVFAYDQVVARSLEEPAPVYPLIKTAVPGWDNDSRRQGTGLVMQGSTPAKYEAWMTSLVDNARRHPFFGEPFVCINAWNEWCEAAYLEPDLHYGSAYLNATGRAVTGLSRGASTSKLLLVGHDAFPSGAQHLLLNIAKFMIRNHGVQLEFLLLTGGAMARAYEDVAPTTVLSDAGAAIKVLAELRKRGFNRALVNTVASTHILQRMAAVDISAVSLIHELPRIIREKNLTRGVEMAFELSEKLVFASRLGYDKLAAEVNARVDDKVRIIPQGLYRSVECSATATAAEKLRRQLKIKKGETLVVGVGYADLRKGFDLFLQLWRQLNQQGGRRGGARVHCCWVGDIDPILKGWLSVEVDAAVAGGAFHMAGYQQDVEPYLFAANAFALTSREDPFPTVVHEALAAGLPVFAFAEAGGMSEFLDVHKLGTISPHGDVIVMARQIAASVARPPAPKMVERRKEFVRTELDFGRYTSRLLRLALPQAAPLSVVIPNYNYAKLMAGRLGSIFLQDYPVEEVVVLDDASTDDSLTTAQSVADEWNRRISLVPNRVNSGSVFAQWQRAAELAKGDLVWIAEADDLSDPAFLSTVVKSMGEDPSICMAFSDSQAINFDGSLLWDSYKGYYAQYEARALSESGVWDGRDFVRSYLAVRNLILNVSAVVWRREALLEAIHKCQQALKGFGVAGDWWLYLNILTAPGNRIAYVSTPLNIHRRHAASVTHRLKAEKHVSEIARCQAFAAEQLHANARLRSEQGKYLKSIEEQLLGGVQAASQSGRSKKSKKKAQA